MLKNDSQEPALNHSGKCLVVLGPTASGKSSLAIDLGRNRPSVIICADSVQYYKGLPLLTAQPELKDTLAVPHVLYSAVDPQEKRKNAALWAASVVQKIQAALEKKCVPIVVGGTGFYVKTLLEGIAPTPVIEPELLKELERKTTQDLWHCLCAEDQSFSQTLQPTDRQRLLRALSVKRQTGRSLKSWWQEKNQKNSFRFFQVVMDLPKEVLHKRIQKRLDQMWAAGLPEEVRSFVHQNLKKSCAAEKIAPIQSLNSKDVTPQGLKNLVRLRGYDVSCWPSVTKALGFIEIVLHLEGVLSFSQTHALIERHTRQYAKRQRTWIKHQVLSKNNQTDLVAVKSLNVCAETIWDKFDYF